MRLELIPSENQNENYWIRICNIGNLSNDWGSPIHNIERTSKNASGPNVSID